jgi:uncharacterized membrane protein YgdD (TMEM256/DUF423 family)
MNAWANGLAIAAGLFGAAGLVAAATTTHDKGGTDLLIASNFLMLQAPAICAVALSARRTNAMFLAAATLMAIGALLFCGDLSARGVFGGSLFPLAAPSGGVAMILGWLGGDGAGAFSRT